MQRGFWGGCRQDAGKRRLASAAEVRDLRPGNRNAIALSGLRAHTGDPPSAMTPQNYKTAAIVCFVLCAIFVFVAIERSQANASSVEAINQLTGSALQLRPATPTGAVYAWFFAILTGVGGAFCLSRAKPKS